MEMLCVITLYLLISTPIAGAGAGVPLFLFGDSLYDTGMTIYDGQKNAGSVSWPYGENYFGQPSGRFCDGRIIPDFISEYAGLPYPTPYLKPGFNDYSNGVSFAAAGACVLVELRPGTVNLKMQVDYFKEMVQKLNQQVGEKHAKELASQAVYLFNIGGNDYVVLLQDNLHKLPLSRSVTRPYIDRVLANLTIHIKEIYNQGGRKFAFQNVGPMGCMPATKNLVGYKGPRCAGEPLQLARMHNALFLVVIKNLQTQLPGFNYTVYDSYTSAYYRVVYPHRYGFTNTNDACCGSGAYNGKYTCQLKNTGFTVCNNPNYYLYFDAGHYTQKANQEFAQQFWSGDSKVVYPYNLKSLFNMN